MSPRAARQTIARMFGEMEAYTRWLATESAYRAYVSA